VLTCLPIARLAVARAARSASPVSWLSETPHPVIEWPAYGDSKGNPEAP